MPLPRFRLRSLMLAVVASACILGGLIQFRPPHEPGDFQLGILLVGLLQRPELLASLVLMSPAAIRAEGAVAAPPPSEADPPGDMSW